MAKLAFLSLLILCCVTFVSCRGKPHTPPAANQDAWKKFIHQTSVRFDKSNVSQWEHDMLKAIPKGAAMDDETVTFMGVNVSLKGSDALLDFMNSVIDVSNWKGTPRDINAAQKCAGELRAPLDALHKSFGQNPKSLSDMQGILKTLSASVNDCLTLAKKFQKNLNEASDKANYAVQSTTIATGLVNDHLNATTLTYTVPTAPPPTTLTFTIPSSPPQEPPTTLNFTIPTNTPPHPSTKSPAPSPGGDWTGFIREACKKATQDYVQICQDDMSGALKKGGGGDMNGFTLTFLAMNVSVDKADSLVDTMNYIVSDSDKSQPQGDRQLARKCVTELHKSLAPLDKIPGRDPRYVDGKTEFFKGLAASETDCQKMAGQFGAGDAVAKQDLVESALGSTNFAITMVGVNFAAPK